MRVRAAKDGLVLRAIAGTNNVLLAMELSAAKRKGCLGFSLQRADLGTGERQWLSTGLRFSIDENNKSVTSARGPIQKFRWGDYTAEPGRRYVYRAVARYGSPSEIVREGIDAERLPDSDTIKGGVQVEVRTENTRDPETAIYFNRGAAASEAYV